MASQAFYDVIARAVQLDANEQLLLIARLTEQASQTRSLQPAQRAWREIAGTATYPIAGEDAQAWVSRSRSEDNAF